MMIKDEFIKLTRPPNECPVCGKGSKITQSKAGLRRIHKRRVCQCGETWSTVEITQDYYYVLLKSFEFTNDIFKEVTDE